MSDKLFIKNSKRRNKSKDFLLSFNIYNLSNDPSLKNIITKPLIKLKENNNNNNIKSSSEKVNEGTNTIHSILKNIKTNNKNRHNYYNVKKKRVFPNLDDVKYIEEYQSSTIRSNGKFLNSKQNQENYSTKFNKKFFIKQNIKKFFLNQNNLVNINDQQKQNKEIIKNNEENNKNGTGWKGLNISSHYLGNTFNNKFGITTNRFYVNKDLILTHTKESNKYKKDYKSDSLFMKNSSSSRKDINLKFITLNMPNNSNYYNGMSSTNIFAKMKNIINNEKLYQKLINQMTCVFKNRIKKYSFLKSYQKQKGNTFNENYFYRSYRDMKQKKLFNYSNIKKENVQNHNRFIERNVIYNSMSTKKNNTFDNHNKYTQIKIRNVNKQNFGANKITLSNDDMELKIYKKKS